MAYDGEVTDAPPALILDKLDEALTVYRPATDDPAGNSLAAPMGTGR
jgi:undecaprenyl-diphosphatase